MKKTLVILMLIALTLSAAAAAESGRKPPEFVGNTEQINQTEPTAAPATTYAPAAPIQNSKVENLAVSVTDPFSAYISWTNAAGGESYTVTWHTILGDGSLCYAGSLETQYPSATLSPIAPGTKFEVRVECASGAPGQSAVFSTSASVSKYSEGRYAYQSGNVYWVNWNQKERTFHWSDYWVNHTLIYRVRADRWSPEASERKYILEIRYTNGASSLASAELLTVMRIPSGGAMYALGQVEADGWTYDKHILPVDLTDMLYGYFDAHGSDISESGDFTFDVYVDRQYAGSAVITVLS